MFIKKTSKRVKGKTYVNHLLVKSISTPKGPRHKVICSLGSLAPAPEEQWLALARRVEAALVGQSELVSDPQVDDIVRRVQTEGILEAEDTTGSTGQVDTDVVAVHTDQVEM